MLALAIVVFILLYYGVITNMFSVLLLTVLAIGVISITMIRVIYPLVSTSKKKQTVLFFGGLCPVFVAMVVLMLYAAINKETLDAMPVAQGYVAWGDIGLVGVGVIVMSIPHWIWGD